jgi:hypothetical protein
MIGKSSDLPATVEVFATKGAGDIKYGISFHRRNDQSPLIIKEVGREGIFSSKGLKPGMIVNEINGINVSLRSPNEAACILMYADVGEELNLVASRSINIRAKKVKKETKWGFTIKNSTKKAGVFVSHINEEKQFRYPELRVGMQVILINGKPCPEEISHATRLIRNSHPSLEIQVVDLDHHVDVDAFDISNESRNDIEDNRNACFDKSRPKSSLKPFDTFMTSLVSEQASARTPNKELRYANFQDKESPFRVSETDVKTRINPVNRNDLQEKGSSKVDVIDEKMGHLPIEDTRHSPSIVTNYEVSISIGEEVEIPSHAILTRDEVVPIDIFDNMPNLNKYCLKRDAVDEIEDYDELLRILLNVPIGERLDVFDFFDTLGLKIIQTINYLITDKSEDDKCLRTEGEGISHLTHMKEGLGMSDLADFQNILSKELERVQTELLEIKTGVDQSPELHEPKGEAKKKIQAEVVHEEKKKRIRLKSFFRRKTERLLLNSKAFKPKSNKSITVSQKQWKRKVHVEGRIKKLERQNQELQKLVRGVAEAHVKEKEPKPSKLKSFFEIKNRSNQENASEAYPDRKMEEIFYEKEKVVRERKNSIGSNTDSLSFYDRLTVQLFGSDFLEQPSKMEYTVENETESFLNYFFGNVKSSDISLYNSLVSSPRKKKKDNGTFLSSSKPEFSSLTAKESKRKEKKRNLSLQSKNAHGITGASVSNNNGRGKKPAQKGQGKLLYNRKASPALQSAVEIVSLDEEEIVDVDEFVEPNQEEIAKSEFFYSLLWC